uniref:Uncharacterized protein n=1 Tax=Arundo donax TaxID=35708 RepID=A0A0A8ZWL8_ARUDO
MLRRGTIYKATEEGYFGPV